MKKRIVILGGGYAGLAALRKLSQCLPSSAYNMELIDASRHHAIKTRFHELVANRRKDRLIRYPIEIFTRAAGARFIHAHIEGIGFKNRKVITSRGEIGYDVLLVTLGGETNYFGVKGARRYAVSLQTYEDACICSERIERLRLEDRKEPRRRIVVCGAGIEGVEVAAMLRQYVTPERCEILVLEKSDTVMARSQCRDSQRDYIQQYFDRHDIFLWLGTAVVQVKGPGVVLESGELVESELVIWCSGVKRATVKGVSRARPFPVNRSLQSLRHPEVFATGDFATVEDDGDFSNLFSAQRALYQAGVMAENARRFEQGLPLKAMAYRPVGELIALGDLDGVGVVAGIPIKGKAAAIMKKANEVKYLAELFRSVPGAAVRQSLPQAVRKAIWKTR